MPTALMEEETPEQQQQLEAQAQIIVRAMINAAKADGQIDEAEVQKIIGRLDDNGLTEEEKNFFLVEARKPMDLQGIIAEAAVSQELAAEVYAASLLAIEVDTPDTHRKCRRDRDAERDEALGALGITVLRVRDDGVPEHVARAVLLAAVGE